MKKYIVLALCLAGVQFAEARPQMCAAGMKEIVACTADAWIPFYPFVSVCQAQNNEIFLSIHPGSTQQAGILAVTVSTNPAATTLTVNDADYSEMAFTFAKVAGAKTKGNLGWSWSKENSYTCAQ